MRFYKTLALMIIVCLFACAPTKNTEVLRGNTMGTTWSVKVVSDGVFAKEKLMQGIGSALEKVNATASNWRENSSVSRFNTAKQVCVEDDLLVLLAKHSADISRASNGAFDVTVSPLIELWGFGVEWTPDLIPAPQEIEAALAKTGATKIEVRDGQLCKQHAGVSANFSAIAKGLAVDQMAKVLEAAGHANFLAEVGGELVAKGFNAKGVRWRIGVKKPVPLESAQSGGMVSKALELTDEAIATSGDYYNFFDVDGQRYSHVINPKTGYPVAHDTVSVTVIADDCMSADAWATALLVLGKARGLKVAEEQQLEVMFIQQAAKNKPLTASYSTHWSHAL